MARLNKKQAGALGAVVALVGLFEGISTVAYKDPVGIPTICFGETRNVHMGDHKTTAECKDMLADRLIEFSAGVDKCLTAKVSDKTYGSYVSLAYNIGVPGFCGSSVARLANLGQIAASCDAMLSWNKGRIAGVLVVLPGLDKRRHAERALCLEGLVT